MSYERKTFDIFISDELRDILLEFESESLVAQTLLKRRIDKDELVDSPVNFISVSRDDRSKISYLTEERIGQISIEQYWTSSKRFQIKPGGFIGKLFKSMPAREVEKFSNLFRTNSNKPKFNFKIVQGSSILKYYHFESYYSTERGSLGASCMKHDSCQDYLNIYTDNSDNIKLLIMLNDNDDLIGRALLWDFDSYKVMDRIYTSNDEELQFYFKKWATDNGYLHKSEQNWYNTCQFEQVGQKKQTLKLAVKLKNTIYRKYPYMDTFKFIDTDGVLYNFQPKEVDFYTLCSSEGSKYEKDYLYTDGLDGLLRHRGDCVFVEYLRIYTHHNNAVYSETLERQILKRDAVYNSEIQDHIFNDEWKELNNSELIESRKVAIKSIKKLREAKKLNAIFGLDHHTILRALENIEPLSLEED